MKEIRLTQGKVALVDDADFEELSKFKWFAKKDKQTFYAARKAQDGARRFCELMHRRLMGFPEGLVIDHINGDGLDNRRANLRVTTSRGNSQNMRKKRAGLCPSRFPGVFWCKFTGRWRAMATIGERARHIGRFDSEEEAASAYRAFVASLEVSP